jgi:multiple antibiotic resistance protein
MRTLYPQQRASNFESASSVPKYISLIKSFRFARHTHFSDSVVLASATAFIVLMVALLAGDPLFHILGISIASFTVGGGIILMLMAIAMLHARPSRVSRTQEEVDEAAERRQLPWFRWAFPLLPVPARLVRL